MTVANKLMSKSPLQIFFGNRQQHDVHVHRGTGCSTIDIGKGLLRGEDHTGNYECCKLFDGSVAKIETAKAYIKTPICTGRVIAFAITYPVTGSILGNIPEIEDKILYTHPPPPKQTKMATVRTEKMTKVVVQ
ncbi:reverse transcriptase [Plakobranchus ocellatus]|uniref:Reverse transcriptase n=1 Tax=Plakobranchus ocellatus TaxID=259542 RepID=A0AAV3YN36_9GAST|nr:reverse transcriptase [Plakobranchus ocellatus]